MWAWKELLSFSLNKEFKKSWKWKTRNDKTSFNFQLVILAFQFNWGDGRDIFSLVSPFSSHHPFSERSLILCVNFIATDCVRIHVSSPAIIKPCGWSLVLALYCGFALGGKNGVKRALAHSFHFRLFSTADARALAFLRRIQSRWLLRAQEFVLAIF